MLVLPKTAYCGGQTVFIKFAGDGFEIAKRDVATAHGITVSNKDKALQIATISLMHASETYQVRICLTCCLVSFAS